eukprot:TRINITY_DN44513_c0_g1_i1.p1 TRINITY_DN44513_c0_g1~~TRINITY_DN44513_c0_g1_i1.p1  ORF type:complete len:338 (-),score=59.48 TRINITY_DN44513_c0_g1_i1:4-1017(-)
MSLNWASYGGLFVLGSCLYAGLGILSQLSKEADGSYAYSMPSVVLGAESTKLLLSCCFLQQEVGGVDAAVKVVRRAPWKSWWMFAVPSAIYSVGNNLDMLCNQYMDSATFQVCAQLKILTTGVLWWCVFRQALGIRKWLALTMLMFGSALAAMPTGDADAPRKMFIEPIGMVLILIYASCSALASVYTEYVYKTVGMNESIHFQNIAMYTFGIMLNFLFYMSDRRRQVLAGVEASWLPMHGYNFWTWCLLANYAFMGLLTSFIMKYLDNIQKLLMAGASMYVSTFATSVLFRLLPSGTFVLGLAMVTGALATYHWEKIEPFFPGISRKARWGDLRDV